MAAAAAVVMAEATAAAVAMAGRTVSMAEAVEAPPATFLQACESNWRGSVRAAWAVHAGAGRFEPPKAHQSSIEDVVHHLDRRK